jgi:protein-disulfide isomerase
VLEKNPKNVKLVMKQFPLRSHHYARQGAAAALAASKQGKFWEFHEKLYANQKNLNGAKVQEIARELGLNMEQFNRDLKDPAIEAMINKDMENARQANVRGTPTIFINGKILRHRSLQGFQQAIDEELKKKKK